MKMTQKTIAKSFSLSGIGIHSGENSTVIVAPAPANSGICFVKGEKKIQALAKNVEGTRRGTFLNGIALTEHLLSAVYALGIDNLEIELRGNELPVLDGSALPYVEALERSGIIEQKALKNMLLITQPVKIVESEASLEALPYRGFKVDFMVDFQCIHPKGAPKDAGKQRLSFCLQNGDFKREIAPARTFGYIEEYEKLKAQGLARGASLDNALVMGKDGYINTPRFSDELVRHKILDLIGDLALLGRPLQAEIKAVKSGHKLNIEMVRKLASAGA